MAQPLATPYSQFFDANGDPLAGGKVYFYAAGTTTPQNTYTDSSGTTPASNPVVLDTAGRATIWLSGFYKIVVKDSSDVLVWETDNVTAYGLTGDMYKSIYDPANIQEQLVGLTAVQTITNKTLTAPILTGAQITTQDSQFIIQDDGDATKQFRFETSGITTGNTRVVTIKDSNGTMAYQYTPVTNSLGADVNLNNTGNFFDGPSAAQGTSGTWFASGTVTLIDTAGGASYQVKLWDGTTVIASTALDSTASNQLRSVSLSGYISSPAGNIRISAKDITSTSGKILYNQTGTGKDSTISVVRIA